MDITPSEHFTPVSLSSIYNCHRDELPDNHPIPEMIIGKSGINEFRGIPFDIGPEDGPNVCLLETETISLDLAGQKASYILFLHAVANETVTALPELPAPAEPGTSFGGLVSDYTIEYEDGESVAHSINRRFAIQQYNNDWGSSAMAAIPACKEGSYRSNSEDSILGTIPKSPGVAECRNVSARDSSNQPRAYIYAMPNPHPDKPLKSLKISPSESSVIYGISLTQLVEHPLRFQQRRKLILTLPEGHEFNAIGELDDIEFDLGNVISARQQLLYKDWTADPVDVQPDRSANTVLIEYATHPAAKLYLKTGDGQKSYDLLNLNEAMLDVSPAHRPVKIRVIDKDSRVAVGVRIHFHGEAGEYLPPKGNHRKVNDNWFMDNYGEFANGANDYAYIHGECILDAPLGTVYVEITRGYEIAPLRESFTVDADTNEICFELERVLDWRNRGWVTADTHVHFLSPATAVLEGEGEDVN
ncbi:MAG: hypothetical protein HRT89_08045, partial [Lentisphaeria bacterium]|nr:hypothetical protein [Lentisphaeria bacterium]NQZ68006.1 hypothetical protein [Lentisphaeria bacterium]